MTIVLGYTVPSQCLYRAHTVLLQRVGSSLEHDAASVTSCTCGSSSNATPCKSEPKISHTESTGTGDATAQDTETRNYSGEK